MRGRENQANSGYMVLQDHDASWPLETREWRGAIRLTGKDKYGRRRTESAGDILCATAWEPASRPFPGWAMAWPSKTTGSDARPKAVGAGPRNRSTEITGEKGGAQETYSATLLPVRSESYDEDARFKDSDSDLPDGFPLFPDGAFGIRIGGTEERSQQEVWLPTDPRLFAVNKSPKGIMGSLVFDLEPEGKIAVGSGAPGIAGRGARLQTAWRVVRLPADPQHLEVEGLPCGNVIAWQGARTGQEKWPGLGAYTTVTGRSPKKDSSGGGITPQITGGSGQSGTISFVAQVGRPASRKDDGGGKSVCAFADHTAMGPLHGGFDDDKHKIDRTLDDERMHPVHVGTSAYYAMDEDRDAPLHFETLPYNANRFPMQARVHLVYDDTDVHPFFAETRRGMWKWYAEVPYLGSGSPPREPTDPPAPPSDPRPPPRPPPTTTPSEPTFFPPQMPGRPRYPGDPPTASPPKGFRGRGGKERNSGSHVWSPDTWGFGSMLWRPQHTRPNGQDFRVGGYSQADAQAEDASRPVVMRAEAWGKQTGLAWNYSRTPSASRYAGGEAAGGVLLLPGPVDMADSSVSWAPTDRNVQEAFFTAGPSVSIAWGLPDTTTGGLSDSSWRFHRDTTVGGYSSITMDVQVASVWTNALALWYDADGVGVGVGGTLYFKSPTGTTAQRPSTPANGMQRYNSTLARMEFRQNGAWNALPVPASGWTAPTGTDQRSGFATSTATLTDVAQTLKSLVGDLLTAGILTA